MAALANYGKNWHLMDISSSASVSEVNKLFDGMCEEEKGEGLKRLRGRWVRGR